jgi:hypothetical protein
MGKDQNPELDPDPDQPILKVGSGSGQKNSGSAIPVLVRLGLVRIYDVLEWDELLWEELEWDE